MTIRPGNDENHTWQRLFSIAFFTFCILPLVLTGNITNLDTDIWGSETLLRLHANMRFRLGDLVYQDSIIHQDHWMVYLNGPSIRDFQNAWKFSRGELKLIHRRLSDLQEYLKKKDIQLIIIIAPNKNTIYPEYVPETIPILSEISRYEQLMTYLGVSLPGNSSQEKWYSFELLMENIEEDEGLHIIDVREPLLKAKEVREIYYHTDTHWNSYGAYIAYKAIMEKVKEKYPQIDYYQLDELSYIRDPERIAETLLLVNLDLHEEYFTLEPEFRPAQGPMLYYDPEGRSEIQIYTIRDVDLPRLLVFHDSFAWELIPFLKEHFSTSTFIRTGSIDLEFIESQKPNILLLEYTERNLERLLSIPEVE